LPATWLAVLASAIGCYAVKVAGTLAPQRVLDRPAVRAAVAQVPVALLAGLVAVQTFTDGARLALDARLVGLAVAAVAVWRRAPFLVVVVAAAAATALARLVLGLP
jgi:uncharacterized membrane protein